MDALSNLVHSFIASDGSSPPPFSKIKVVAAISAVAAVYFGWRYAPKLTITVIASTCLYYGAQTLYRFYYPSINLQEKDLIETKKDTNQNLKPPQNNPKDDLLPTPANPVQSVTTQDDIKAVLTLSSLEDVKSWINQLLAYPSLKPDIFPVLSCLWNLKPEVVSQYLKCTYQFVSKEFMDKAQTIANTNMPKDPEAWGLQALTKTLDNPQERAYLLASIEAQIAAKALSITVSELPNYIENLLQQQPQNQLIELVEGLIKDANKKDAPAIEYMETVFSLCAALEKHPDSITQFTPRLKTLELSETALKEPKFRVFILTIIHLSRYLKFDGVLKQINPQKFEKNKQNFATHPLNIPSSLDISLYTHWIALRAWHKIMKTDIASKTINDFLAQLNKAIPTSFEALILKSHLIKEVQDYLKGIDLKIGSQPTQTSEAHPQENLYKDIFVWVDSALTNKSPTQDLSQDLCSIFSSLYKRLPATMTTGLDTWTPPIPGSERFKELAGNVSDDLIAKLVYPSLTAQETGQDFYEVCEKNNDPRLLSVKNAVGSLKAEEEFMKAVYAVSLALKKHPSLVIEFVEKFGLRFKKERREKLPDGHVIKDNRSRELVLKILWLSQKTEAIEFLKSRYKKDDIEKFPLPDQASDLPLGASSYRHLVFISTTFLNSKPEETEKQITDLIKIFDTSWQQQEGLDLSQKLVKAFMRQMAENIIKKISNHFLFALLDQVNHPSIAQLILDCTRYLYLITPNKKNLRDFSVSRIGSKLFMEALKKELPSLTNRQAEELIEYNKTLTKPQTNLTTSFLNIRKSLLPKMKQDELLVPRLFSFIAAISLYPALQSGFKKAQEIMQDNADETFKTFLADINWLALHTDDDDHPLKKPTNQISEHSYQTLFMLFNMYEVTENQDYLEKINALKQTAKTQLATYTIDLNSCDSTEVYEILSLILLTQDIHDFISRMV